jgi:hypothetical protein
MSYHDQERFIAHGSSIEETNSEVEKEVQSYQDALNISLKAAIQPVTDLHESISVLLAEGRNDDVPKLTGLVKMIARDADVLLAEKKVLDEKFDQYKNNPPKKKRQLSDHHSNLMSVGASYLALSQRSMNTVGAAMGDYMDILSPLKGEAAEPKETSEAVS